MRKENYKDKTQEKPFSSHEFKKSLGQNFLRDTNLLKAIVLDANVNDKDVVLEIGAGAGTLTKEISDVAKSVVSYEVDKSLEPILRSLESEQRNLKIVFQDALKTTNQEIFETLTEWSGEHLTSYKVVANIPYYITTPLLFKFLKDDKVSSITIMVQKEVAERIVSKSSKSEYGAVTVMVNYFGRAEIKRIVKRDMFYPAPKVDSAILHITKHEQKNNQIFDVLEEVVKTAFMARRKMMINNLSIKFNLKKEMLAEIFKEIKISPTARAEELEIEDYIKLSQKLSQIRQI